MLQNINRENFYQTLNRFSTPELENLIQKFPYFHQAHLLLAKKYQQESSSKFDEQLQLAALYTQDRDLLFAIFNETNISAPVSIVQPIPIVEEEVISEKKEIIIEEEILLPEPVIETSPVEEAVEELEQLKEEEILLEAQTVETVDTTVEEEFIAEEKFNVSELHTFDEWLKAFGQKETLKIEFIQEEIPTEPEKQDEELDKIILQNAAVHLHELVESESNYSKGLNAFIEEQKQKHKPSETKVPHNENEMSADMVTETLAKLYEAQKKYQKAIRAYEVLALKYPEKNDFFAARIIQLKNLI
ncbi:MAG: tetratricopeptide repeat protein [Bacteroidetes bacterium]|nr:tetratricopeptide repeat protein [Bacteroidota bacterium]